VTCEKATCYLQLFPPHRLHVHTKTPSIVPTYLRYTASQKASEKRRAMNAVSKQRDKQYTPSPRNAKDKRWTRDRSWDDTVVSEVKEEKSDLRLLKQTTQADERFMPSHSNNTS